MTISKAHAQMLATLACDSRPTGSRQWNPEAVMAEIVKLRDRSLSAVSLAVLRAAADRGAERPEVISSSGSHWNDTMLPTAYVPNSVPIAERCSVCSLSQPACRIRWAHDHQFESAVDAAKRTGANPEATTRAIAALKEEVAMTPKREPAPEGLDALADRNPRLKERVDRLRDEVPGLRDPELRERETAIEDQPPATCGDPTCIRDPQHTGPHQGPPPPDQLRANNASLAPMRMQEPDVQAAGETSEGARA